MTPNSKHGRAGPEHRTYGFHVNSRTTITACSIKHMISNLVRILRMRSSEEDRNKGINGLAPEYISSMLTYISEQHERHTGSIALNLLHIPRSHLSLFDRAFSFQGSKLCNSLPTDIRNNSFKSALKRYLLINN